MGQTETFGIPWLVSSVSGRCRPRPKTCFVCLDGSNLPTWCLVRKLFAAGTKHEIWDTGRSFFDGPELQSLHFALEVGWKRQSGKFLSDYGKGPSRWQCTTG